MKFGDLFAIQRLSVGVEFC